MGNNGVKIGNTLINTLRNLTITGWSKNAREFILWLGQKNSVSQEHYFLETSYICFSWNVNLSLELRMGYSVGAFFFLPEVIWVFVYKAWFNVYKQKHFILSATHRFFISISPIKINRDKVYHAFFSYSNVVTRFDEKFTSFVYNGITSEH